MKLWQKGDEAGTSDLQKEVQRFTIGTDTDFDKQLAPFDVMGSIAHAKMLERSGLLTKEETGSLVNELKNIYKTTIGSGFQIDAGVEDIHSQVELVLTKKLGDIGKKIHNARSRNDQVLLDIKLFLRQEIEELTTIIVSLFKLLQSQSEKYKDHHMPGYTHLQLAMPSSFGLWFGAYAESLVDDMIMLRGAYDVVNKNPLGSAAGYGTSFPIKRSETTTLLGFAELNYNSIYAQMGRGKTERIVSQALSNFAETLSRLCMDACLFMNQNFGFISFPEELTTGSSIMPHKKNPDVFELIRAHCNKIKSLPNEIALITTNLPSGYHRDMQLLKESLFPALSNLKDCCYMAALMLTNIEIKEDLLKDEKYKYLFSVEEVNKMVLQGMPFRDAYKKIGIDIAMKSYTYDTKLNHTHEGSIGNLCNDMIKEQMDAVVKSFPFKKVNDALGKLVE